LILARLDIAYRRNSSLSAVDSQCFEFHTNCEKNFPKP
jgi:hypothetical protein